MTAACSSAADSSWLMSCGSVRSIGLILAPFRPPEKMVPQGAWSRGMGRDTRPTPHQELTAQIASRDRHRNGAALVLIICGHAGTFAALAGGALWLAVRGPLGLPEARGVLTAGLWMQSLPVVGFALLTHGLANDGRAWAASGASGLAGASLLAMLLGLAQMGASEVPSSTLAAATLILTFGVAAIATAAVVRACRGHVETDLGGLELEEVA